MTTTLSQLLEQYPRTDEIIASRARLLDALTAAIDDVDSSESRVKLAGLVHRIRRNDADDYVGQSLDNPVRVAYSPDGVHRWDYNRRQTTKLHRYLRRMTEKLLNEHDIDIGEHTLSTFAAQAATYLHNPDVELLTGDDIVEAYANAVGSRSCMTGDCSSYVRIYAENPDVCRLLVMRNGVFTARALVWNTDDGDTVVDRIYSDNHTVAQPKIEQFAAARGWLVRRTSCQFITPIVNGEAKRAVDTSSITLKWDVDDEWPYFDTFRYVVQLDDTTFRLHNRSNSATEWIADHTDGCLEDDRIVCDCCGERCDEDDVTRVDNETYCQACLDDRFVWSDRENEYLDVDSAICVDDEWVRDDDDDLRCCPHCHEYYLQA